MEVEVRIAMHRGGRKKSLARVRRATVTATMERRRKRRPKASCWDLGATLDDLLLPMARRREGLANERRTNLRTIQRLTTVPRRNQNPKSRKVLLTSAIKMLWNRQRVDELGV